MRSKRASWTALVGLALLSGAAWSAAQETASADACGAALQAVWTAASDACIGKPAGYVCNGGGAPQAEPPGAVANALMPVGALVETDVLDAVLTPPIAPTGSSAGVAWLRVSAPIPFSGLLVGDVDVRDATLPEFSPWQSLVVQTAPEPPACSAAPHNVFVVQNAVPQQPANIAINGVSLGLNGTVLVWTPPEQTVFVGLAGVTTLFAAGQEQTLRPGQQVSVPHLPGNYNAPIGAPSPPTPLDVTLAQNLPVALLDRPVILPQPGYVVTQGAVNLRAAPSTDAGVIVQVPAGQVLSVLGRNPGGDWLHVRLDTGETGWMFAQLLLQNLGEVRAVYEATPLPPQRFGERGRTARVLAPAGVNLRQAPDVSFAVVGALPDRTPVNLVARSPYSPWVKVEAGGLTGWLALITVETDALIDALPIDYNVPPPPPPTRVPGSFGNAFPDPRQPGN